MIVYEVAQLCYEYKSRALDFIQILSLLRLATVTFRPTLRASLSSNSFISFILLINHVEDVQGTANFIQILSLLRLVPEYFHPTLRASLPSNSFISFILLVDHV